MRILLSSHLFPPSVGGIEQVGWLLAQSFVELGHEVKVVTQTPGPNKMMTEWAPSNIYPLAPEVSANWPEVDTRCTIPVLRRPSRMALIHATRWCDVVLHSQISLQTAWPLLFVRRPWAIVHHTWLARANGTLGWQDRLKRSALRFGSSIGVSAAIGQSLPVSSVVLPNPYDEKLFVERADIPRNRELIFIGRLVSDKGLDLLLQALAQLRRQDLTPQLTVVGDGPESPRLKQFAFEQGIKSQVQFVGTKVGEELVSLLNEHQVMVVPSRWREPFGLVALEGIACGCVVVGSSGGGLPEAIGRCGVTFPNGNSERLAEVLSDLLHHPIQWAGFRAHARKHLQKHQRLNVARAYLAMLEKIRRGQSNPFELSERDQPGALRHAA